MRILALADREAPSLWESYNPHLTEGVDLIISCGDLSPQYLEFLVTVTNIPLLYVRGNHDSRYDETPPLGCTCIEDRVHVHDGVRILGLGGSMRYRNGGDQFTEAEMKKRVKKAERRIASAGGIDILVTHAPALGHGDLDDLPHRGFGCFNDLMMRHRPAYHLHGHVHQEYGDFVRERAHPSGTRILNACRYCYLELPS